MSLPLDALPTELLEHIVGFLSSSSSSSLPSARNIRQLPSHSLTTAAVDASASASASVTPLKSLCRVSSRCLALARPCLFRHARFELRDQPRFLAFLRRHGLARYVHSVVVSVRSIFRGSEKPRWWRDLFAELDPLAVTVVAPPYMFAEMAQCPLEDTHAWAFHLPLQIMHFRQPDPRGDRRGKAGKARKGEEDEDEEKEEAERGEELEVATDDDDDTFLSARPWTEVLFNEGSSLRAYSTYEYYLLHPPSVMVHWGSVNPLQAAELPYPHAAIARLTSFCYTAIFPFYNHTNLVLKVVRNMTSLRHLAMQLAPAADSTVFEDEQRTGTLDPNDPWMELETSYALISHSVRYLGVQARLAEFRTYDFQLAALRENLFHNLATVLGEKWVHDGNGLWTRLPTARSRDYSTNGS